MMCLIFGHMQDWEPLSSQRRQAVSVVEVFRIVEEVCIIIRRVI